MSNNLNKAKFEAMLKLALEEQLQLEEPILLPDDKGKKGHDFSWKFRRKVKQLKRKTKEGRAERSRKMQNGIAAAVVMVLLGTALAFNVDAFKIPAYNLIMQVKDDYSSVNWLESAEEVAVPEEFAEFMPDYVPKGFRLAYARVETNTCYLKYKNGNKVYVLDFYKEGQELFLDTEKTGSKLIPGDSDNIIEVVKGELIQLSILKNNNLYSVSGDITKEEGIKILKSIN